MSPTLRLPRIGVTPGRDRHLFVVNWSQTSWRPDLHADLRLRAMLGMQIAHGFDGVTVSLGHTHLGRVGLHRVDEAQAELARIFDEAELYGLKAPAGPAVRSAALRRPVDWETLVPFWKSWCEAETVKTAIGRGFFLSRGQREHPDFAAYCDYCQIATRPVVGVRMMRTVAEIDVGSPARKPPVIGGDFINELWAMIAKEGPRKMRPWLFAEPGDSRLRIAGIRAAEAERVAWWAFEQLSR